MCKLLHASCSKLGFNRFVEFKEKTGLFQILKKKKNNRLLQMHSQNVNKKYVFRISVLANKFLNLFTSTA